VLQCVAVCCSVLQCVAETKTRETSAKTLYKDPPPKLQNRDLYNDSRDLYKDSRQPLYMVKRVSEIIPKRVMEAWDANVHVLFH